MAPRRCVVSSLPRSPDRKEKKRKKKEAEKGNTAKLTGWLAPLRSPADPADPADPATIIYLSPPAARALAGRAAGSSGMYARGKSEQGGERERAI